MADIVFIVIQLLFVVYLLYYIIAFISGAPFVPSNNPVALRMIELAGIKKGNIVYDLGSGDGKLLRLAASKGAKATGFEINPILVAISRLLGSHTVAKSFWKIHLKQADILFVYLLPWHMDKLEKKIIAECKTGTIIVSNSFMFPTLQLVAKDTSMHVFVYRVIS